ncbi:MAG: pyridoxal phosphate-dependent aminotransferase [Fulvimarina manganoxydans]|uniref:pyridoxal phosphate-dependent aminotransferase n=1 Tax=Fulvimarina manganoxydans TaxID=937218 RepID=UPI0023555921|nr:pyridoxal phosphate-dependent aminotransferase [Fulvimarina manganoxydans]MCK5933799.1 pyridoxal phosphate-dependent aminotransferase [Fulvimarina manganoxydans]
MTASQAFRRSARIASLEISEIVQITERAASLRAEGADIVALSTGEPDFPTPSHVVEAAHQAALAGRTKYPATLGTPELRDLIASQNGVGRANVIVSTGAKQVLANAMLASLDPGDEVVMPAPYWTSYSDIVALAGGAPVVVPCTMETGFRITPERLDAAITPRTRWVMLNSPSNPTGAIYSRDELRSLAGVLQRHPHVMVLVDEIYDHLSFTDFASMREVVPELSDRMLIVNGVSKAYAMTGWRIGWGIGPADMIFALGAVQGQITSGASAISQAAAVAALSGPQELLAERLAILKTRRDLVVSRLNAMPGITCPVPDGAFYVFPDVTGAMAAKGLATCAEFCTALLETQGLALVPGRAFGLPGHLRLSFAYSQANLEAGLDRLERFLSRPPEPAGEERPVAESFS